MSNTHVKNIKLGACKVSLVALIWVTPKAVFRLKLRPKL